MIGSRMDKGRDYDSNLPPWEFEAILPSLFCHPNTARIRGHQVVPKQKMVTSDRGGIKTLPLDSPEPFWVCDIL